MMFLVRSTFWLGIVVSNMPLDVADRAQGAVAASAAGAVKAACAQESASCRAILAAAGAGLASSPERSPDGRGAPRAGVMGKARRPSANSLGAADLETPWRGRPAKSGA
ncbi:MAG: hypothetical protein ABSE69_12665 [Roseiarcus sp.]|jgi:hypothetical protein